MRQCWKVAARGVGLALWVLVLAALVTNCGGGTAGGPGPGSAGSSNDPAGAPATGATGPTGGVVISMVWPEAQSKLLPAGCKSVPVVLSMKAGGGELGRKLVVRPDNKATFEGLSSGIVCTLTATAYPNADGTGTAQATGQVDVTIPAGTVAAVGLTLGSTITTVVVTPASPITVALGGT